MFSSSSFAVFVSVYNWSISDLSILCGQAWITELSRNHQRGSRTRSVHCNADYSPVIYVWFYCCIHDSDWWSTWKRYLQFLFFLLSLLSLAMLSVEARVIVEQTYRSPFTKMLRHAISRIFTPWLKLKTMWK